MIVDAYHLIIRISGRISRTGTAAPRRPSALSVGRFLGENHPDLSPIRGGLPVRRVMQLEHEIRPRLEKCRAMRRLRRRESLAGNVPANPRATLLPPLPGAGNEYHAGLLIGEPLRPWLPGCTRSRDACSHALPVRTSILLTHLSSVRPRRDDHVLIFHGRPGRERGTRSASEVPGLACRCSNLPRKSAAPARPSGSPSFAPPSTHATSVSISSCDSERSLANLPTCGSANHGGIFLRHHRLPNRLRPRTRFLVIEQRHRRCLARAMTILAPLLKDRQHVLLKRRIRDIRRRRNRRGANQCDPPQAHNASFMLNECQPRPAGISRGPTCSK